MAKLITGLQGSGKSYWAMNEIFTSGDKYVKIYSNIDELKNTDRIHSLDFNEFVKYGLSECYKIMVTSNNGSVDIDDDDITVNQVFNKITSQSATFSDAIKHLQFIKILPDDVSEEKRVMIIIDEAQNFFGQTVKLSPELLWLITQHRHLYLELILLTQDVSLIRSNYKLFNEVYCAVPPTKQFNAKYFTYKHYAGLPISPGNFVGKIKIKKQQEIFDLYTSGDKVESPNILKRYFIMGIIALALMVLTFMYVINDLTSSTTDKPKKTETTLNDKPVQHRTYKDIGSNTDSKSYLKLNCFSKKCINKNLHINSKCFRFRKDIKDYRFRVT